METDLNLVRVTDLNEADSLTGTEVLEVIQDSESKQAPLNELNALAILERTSGFTVDKSLSGKVVEYNSSSNGNVTIPPDTDLPNVNNGIFIVFRQVSTGQINITGGLGVTLNYRDGLQPNTSSQWSQITVQKRATDTWFVTGDLSV